MSITLATGTVLAIASTYGSSFNITALTNAAEAVATVQAGHGITVGDYLEITSGWGRLNGRVVRAKTVATNDVTLEGVNTSSTTYYPTGTGTGSVRRITAWTNLSQVKDMSTSGGEQQFANTTAIDDVVAKQVPTIRGAVAMTINVFDDPTLAWYAAAVSAADSSTPTGFRMSFPNSSKLVANAYWSVMKVPTVSTNEAMTSQVTLSYAAEPARYST